MKLKIFREKEFLSQAQLAKKLGVTQGYISQIEKGRKEPTIRLLRQIAKVLNTSVSELIEEQKIIT